ncbi:ephrin type-A receptor 3 isoform X2 [Patella vulgata]|uniref:ephrin type-A receptor 3 isoform X2 n=1 Tax=Patella vulgata TaxID=6465 RepID=UPI0024A8D404|nr:ephrin type-A receptor 3 isoform X2 [Patella vulgata]
MRMKYGYFVQISVLFWTIGSTAAGGRTSIVTLSRCRVECIKNHTKPPLTADGKTPLTTDGKTCTYTPDCHYCWILCMRLFESYIVWGPTCTDDRVCTPGCKTACKFRQARPKVTPSHLHWQFPEDVIVKADSLNTLITWPRPTPDGPETSPSPFVYTLLARNTSWIDKSWHQYAQQISEEVSIKTDQLPYAPEFKLMAVNDQGLATEMKFKGDSYVFGKVFPPFGGLREATPGSMTVDTHYNITYNITELKNGRLQLNVSWLHPPEVADKVKPVLYNVNWFLDDCNVFDGPPRCDHPVEHYERTVEFVTDQQSQLTITELLYNTQYTIRMELSDDPEVNSYIVFTTPQCMTPDVTFKKCIRLTPEEEEKEEKLLGEMDMLLWHLNVSSMTLNSETDTVKINVTWMTPFNNSAVNYSLIWEMEDNRNYFQMGREKTYNDFFVLIVDPENIYRVRAEAGYLSEAGEPRIFDSEWLFINTSRILLDNDDQAMYKSMQESNMRETQNEESLEGVIIAVTCVSFIALGFIIFFIYKKRKSFKDIIITKSTVAKSNSYKSNVGGKSDYSNQLMVISDEWELDPKQLKFCAPVGQGAFGKVVTGYFNDMKVAIKLIKEGAPLSYKEDLVAEINLMKKIGPHPNIVSMIGACTLLEPVALVMEFLPRGNLQTFLKKCRMEGDFRKGTDGQSEIIYSLVQDTGGIDNGVIIPADMLSFARQVAMAMEYLAEKKYVHRDLAARNVLLDHNKVVKVCDFGLSRDIYNDNEYKKLTNGKLPLKWMAIESLRDRIFTTSTDVWSFGILLWEIVTMGASPYPNIALADLYYILSNGYRMEKPSNCSDELYRIMRQCWEDHPSDRPTFLTLRLMLEELLEQDCDYLLLDNIDVPLNLSENSSNPIDISHPGGGATAARPPVSTPPRPAYTVRRDKNLKVNVCVHDQSTERLIYRPSESDSTSSP